MEKRLENTIPYLFTIKRYERYQKLKKAFGRLKKRVNSKKEDVSKNLATQSNLGNKIDTLFQRTIQQVNEWTW